MRRAKINPAHGSRRGGVEQNANKKSSRHYAAADASLQLLREAQALVGKAIAAVDRIQAALGQAVHE